MIALLVIVGGCIPWDSLTEPIGDARETTDLALDSGAVDLGTIADRVVTDLAARGWMPRANVCTGSSIGTVQLNGVWGASANDVWAVGNAGTILHWNGSCWSAQFANVTTANLDAVWGNSASSVWTLGTAVSSKSTLLHWNGAWSDVRQPAMVENLSGIAGYGDTLWTFETCSAVRMPTCPTTNTKGLWWKWQGRTQSWSQVLDWANPYERAWAYSESDIYAISSTGRITGSASAWMRLYPSGTIGGPALNGIWGSSANDVWAVGASGTVVHFNGTQWASTAQTSYDLRDVRGTAANSVWAVGDQGAILFWNGTTWTAQPSGVTANLRAVGIVGSEVWAVGEGGTILHKSP